LLNAAARVYFRPDAGCDGQSEESDSEEDWEESDESDESSDWTEDPGRVRSLSESRLLMGDTFKGEEGADRREGKRVVLLDVGECLTWKEGRPGVTL